MGFKFEKLKIWQTALELSGEISNMMKQFPKDELFVLISQIKEKPSSPFVYDILVLKSEKLLQ